MVSSKLTNSIYLLSPYLEISRWLYHIFLSKIYIFKRKIMLIEMSVKLFSVEIMLNWISSSLELTFLYFLQ